MSKKRRSNFKKSAKEVQNYRDSLTSGSFVPSGTIPLQNENLQGSDEYDSSVDQISSNETIRKKPMWYRFSDWIKEHIFPVIISTIVAGIITAVITHQVSIAVIQTQIQYIERKIESIDVNSVDKELLELQLRDIVAQINSSYSIALNDISWQLKELSERIDGLQETSK